MRVVYLIWAANATLPEIAIKIRPQLMVLEVKYRPIYTMNTDNHFFIEKIPKNELISLP